ncbi:unnamed protein product, partial [Tetraodon nigroviridis]
GCVTPLAIPQDGRPEEQRGRPEPIMNAASKQETQFHLTDLPRGPAVAPHKKPPQFMLDLFNVVSVSHGTPKSQKEILDGSIVRSFEDKGHAGERFHFFNLSSFGREERMIKAEFRWFRKKQKIYLGKFYAPHICKVSKWILNSQENNGILMVITLPSGIWMESVADTKAYLVIFSDEERMVESHQSHLATEPARRAGSAPEFHNGGARTRRASPEFLLRGQSQSCQRVPLFVDFEEIGWSGWIISPRGYNAHHCAGSCPFPLGGHLKATNHATVRSIMHALKLSSDVGAPCCVPDKLQSISLMYFDDEENVVLKQYDDMVALSCGCH